MLVRFSLDPAALPCEPLDIRDRGLHLDVLRMWEDQGLLVHDGEALWQRVADLPDGLRKMWQVALACFPAERKRDVAALASCSDRPDPMTLATLVDVVGFDESTGKRWGLTSDCPTTRVPPTDLEVCILPVLPHAERFRMNAVHRLAPLLKDSAIDEVWRDRFALLAERSNHVTIFDRYGAEALVREPRQGLATFLRCLDRHPRERIVTVVAAHTSREVTRESIEAAFERLAESLSGEGVLEIQLFLHACKDDWVHNGHDRFVLFHDALVELGAGLGALGEKKVIKDSTFRVMGRQALRTPGTAARPAALAGQDGAAPGDAHLEKIKRFQGDKDPLKFHPPRHRRPEDWI
jgi:hypothetical protein